jgi:riboflavin biosynthesis pyrimidine reductase
VVLDSQLRIPLESKLVRTAGETQTSVFCRAGVTDSEKVSQLKSLGVNVGQLESLAEAGGLPDQRLRLDQLLAAFTDSHLLVEPGPTLARGFFEQNAADRLWVIRSPMVIGDHTAPTAAAVPDHFVKTGDVDLDGDVLCEYLNAISDVFYAAVPSADFILAQTEHVTEPGGAGPVRGDTPRL